MPRTGHRRSLTIAAAVIATLAAPVAAHAATYTVAAGGASCASDTTCEGLPEAAAAAQSGDIFNVSPGTYVGATFSVGGVTITGSTTAPGVAVTSTITFSGSGATPSVLEKVAIVPSTSSAVAVTGTAGLALRDSLIVSTGGPGMTISNGANNSITRSTIVSASDDAVAVRPGTAATTLTLDSSVLSAGAGATGLSVKTGVSQVPGTAGGATIAARHITVAGSSNGIVVDSSGATGLPAMAAVGSIAATVTDSIVLGASSATPYPGLLPGVPLVGIAANTAALAFTRTDQTTGPTALFVNPARRNFHLRPDALSVIDKGMITAGDSATDIDGQPRTSGAASDLGADEFVNDPPKAVIEVKTSPQRTGRPVAFDGSKSTDRETGVGGGITKYHWEFGDGKAEDTTAPTVNHTYAGEGDTTAKLTVTDAQGAVSPVASVAVKLIDGTAPTIVITKPTANQKIRLTTRTTKTRTVTVNGKTVKRKTTTIKRTKIRFAGTAKDKSGVKVVVITVERTSRAASTSTATSAAATTTKRCAWLDPKKGIVLRSCSKPVLILAKLATDGSWTYNVKSTIKLSAGKYRVSAAGQDNAGATGNSAAAKDAIHRFTLLK